MTGDPRIRSEEDLAAIGQDTWLTTCPAAEYRDRVEAGCGDTPLDAVGGGHCLARAQRASTTLHTSFGGRPPEGCFFEVLEGLQPPSGEALDEGPGRLYVAEMLTWYGVTLT